MATEGIEGCWQGPVPASSWARTSRAAQKQGWSRPGSQAPWGMGTPSWGQSHSGWWQRAAPPAWDVGSAHVPRKLRVMASVRGAELQRRRELLSPHAGGGRVGSVTTAQPGYCWPPFPGKQWRERCRVSLAGRSPGHHVAQRLAPLVTHWDMAAGGAVTLCGGDVSGVERWGDADLPSCGSQQKAPGSSPSTGPALMSSPEAGAFPSCYAADAGPWGSAPSPSMVPGLALTGTSALQAGGQGIIRTSQAVPEPWVVRQPHGFPHGFLPWPQLSVPAAPALCWSLARAKCGIAELWGALSLPCTLLPSLCAPPAFSHSLPAITLQH